MPYELVEILRKTPLQGEKEGGHEVVEQLNWANILYDEDSKESSAIIMTSHVMHLRNLSQ